MQIIKSLLAATLLVVGAVSASAQSVPNYTGTWELNAAKSNFGQFPPPGRMTITVEQTATNIKTTQVMSSPQGDFTTNVDFSLDGKPTSGTGMGGATTSTTAKLDATGLTANTKMTMQGGEMSQTAKWLLSADGKTLTIDQGMTSQMGEMSFHIVFDKKP